MNIRENIFIKNVSILSIGTIISQLINIGGLLLLSRLYSVEEFGNLALFMAYGSIVFSFSTLKFDLAIVKAKRIEEKLVLIRLAFFSIMLISCLIGFGLYIYSFWSDHFDITLISIYFFFFLANGGNQVLVYFFNSEKKYLNISAARILLVVLNLIFAILFFYWKFSIGLVLALAISNIFSFLTLLFLFKRNGKKVWTFSKVQTKKVFSENFQFVKFSTPASFLDTLSYQIIFIFLAEYFSKEITGAFFMAMRVIFLPLSLVGNAISQVFYKNISDKMSNQNLTKKDFWQIWKTLAGLGLIPFLLLFLFGEDLFVLFLGQEWELAGKMATILAIAGFFIFISSPTSTGFVVLNEQKYNLINSSIRLIYTIVFLFLGVLENDIFTFLWLYTIAEFVMIILYNFVMMDKLGKRIG